MKVTFSLSIAVVLMLLNNALFAENIIVTSVVDGAPGSLREAIVNAVAGDTISFDTAATNGLLQSLTEGPIIIDKSLKIFGESSLSTLISGNDQHQVFVVSGAEVNLFIYSLTILNGATTASGGGIFNDGATISLADVNFNNCTSSGTGITEGGGGIANHGGSISLTECSFYDNTAAGIGGAILNLEGSIDINAVIVQDNSATQGGGIWSKDGFIVAYSLMVRNNTASGEGEAGGGIFNETGILELNWTFIINNEANGDNSLGGGIFNSVDGALLVIESEFIENSASGSGGGIADKSGPANLTALSVVKMSNNSTGTTQGNGGALYTYDNSIVDIEGSDITNNTAFGQGGGIYAHESSVYISGTIVAGNSVLGANNTEGGGGIFSTLGYTEIERSAFFNNVIPENGQGTGAGIHNAANNTTIIRNCTMASNTAENSSGGAIANDGRLEVIASTIAENSASEGGGILQTESAWSTSIRNTIIAHNNDGGDLGGVGTFTSLGYNLIGENTPELFVPLTSDIVNDDPNLGPLLDNGGSTRTMAILCPSPAYNTGNPGNIFPDQRGMEVFGGRRDRGAYELQEECISSVNDPALQMGSKLYPNPTNEDQFHLDLSSVFGDVVEVRINEMGSGKLLQQRLLSLDNATISLNGLPNGTYQVQLLSNGRYATHKLVVLR